VPIEIGNFFTRESITLALAAVWGSGAWIIYQILRGNLLVGLIFASIWVPLVLVISIKLHKRGQARLIISLVTTILFLAAVAWFCVSSV